jgi:Ca2+-binding EF-hand superfamily protein
MKEEKLWSTFKYFDVKDTGYITSESVIDALRANNGVVDASGLVSVFDGLKKSNKRLNFQEFKNLFSEVSTLQIR